MSKNKFFALTIGPIVDTISSARTTREMWASSYLFSYIIKKLVESFDRIGMDILLPSREFINKNTYCGAGIYPDRIIAGSSLSKKDIEKEIKDVISDLSSNIFKHLKSRSGKVYKGKIVLDVDYIFTEKEINDYLNEYLRIYYFQKELKSDENIIDTLYPYLDVMELQPRILKTEDRKSVLLPFLKNSLSKAEIYSSPLRIFTDLVNSSFLIDDGYGNSEERMKNGLSPKRRLSTISEIATAQLKNISEKRYEDFENAIQNEIKELWQLDILAEQQKQPKKSAINILKNNFKEEYRTYHNYMAVVTADGDKIGSIIKSLTNATIQGQNETTQKDAIKKFSYLLSDFAVKATKIIDSYGATPVYIGGEDLFFFAPVVGRDTQEGETQTVFDLIKTLDSLFDQVINKQTEIDFGLKEGEGPTLSFGISITYYKFPLYEAKNMSYHLLFNIAKEQMGRNAIATTIIKNSGHNISFEISKKDGALFDKFLKLVKDRISTKDNFINSVTYKLDSFKAILSRIAGDKSRVESLLKNNFNENYYANLSFYQSLRDYIVEIAKAKDGLTEAGYRLLYGTLRFIHFIRSNEKE